MPDEPVASAGNHYMPVGSGIKSFQPVEPMPWGDVNKRVTPEQKTMPAMPDMKKMQ